MTTLRVVSPLVMCIAVACGGQQSSENGLLPDGGAGGGSSTSSDASAGAGGERTGIAGASGSGGTTSTGTLLDAGRDSGARIRDGGDGATAVISSDPHAEERKKLVTDYCSVLQKYSCLAAPVGASSAVDCAQRIYAATFSEVPVECWTELRASLSCASAYQYQCGVDVQVLPYSGGSSEGPCLAERQTMDACIRRYDQRGSVSGTRTTCNWWQAPGTDVCEVSCGADPLRSFSSQCVGPSTGPFSCGCMLNGRVLVDELAMPPHGFVSASCAGAAQAVADGACLRIADCCYTRYASVSAGSPVQELCGCTADPSQGGFATCAAAAQVGGGEVVDLCPQYAPNSVVLRPPTSDGGP